VDRAVPCSMPVFGGKARVLFLASAAGAADPPCAI
jgi:hypothetical protein